MTPANNTSSSVASITRAGSQWSSAREAIYRVSPLLIVVFVFGVFARTMSFGLYWDDYHHARPWTLAEVLGTFAGPFDPLGLEPPYFRPLAVVSFAVDWLLWGYNAWGYHLTNVALHALTSLLVQRLLLALRSARWVALAGALAFALIPANAATAIYISERSDALAAIFTVGGLLATIRYWESGRAGWLVLLNLMVVLAVSSKEIGIVVPALNALLWVYLAFDAATPAAGDSSGLVGAWRARVGAAAPALLGAGGRWRLARVIVPPLVLLAAYLLYRALVLPTGVDGPRYGSSGLIRSYASAVNWTMRGVPWEVPGRTLPLLGAGLAVGIMLRPRSAAWRFVLLGAGWVLVSCLPFALLGQAEPRLLYVPEVGHALIIAGLAGVLSEVVREGLAKRTRRGQAAAAGALAVGLAFTAMLLTSQLQAQDEFQPFGYKMLRADYQIYTSPRERALYPEVAIQHIEWKLRQAGKIP